jgi:dTDP-4-dehydrorhamnose 3,5-epimerase
MIFTETPLKGAFLIELEKKGDERGFFARFFCKDEFADFGLFKEFKQVNNSFSALKGTLRGLHYQLMPSTEVKILRCISGAIFDVILDLRPDSPDYGRWFGRELSSDNRLMIYVPRGFAHGFMTLTNNTEVLYFASENYSPELEKGIRYNDSHFTIKWPNEPVEISHKDANWPDFNPDWHQVEMLNDLV